MFKYITKTAKETTHNILRLCTNQYKYKFYRMTSNIRRGQRYFITNLWDERAFLRGIFHRVRSQVTGYRNS